MLLLALVSKCQRVRSRVRSPRKSRVCKENMNRVPERPGPPNNIVDKTRMDRTATTVRRNFGGVMLNFKPYISRIFGLWFAARREKPNAYCIYR
jgi:hypothetical protein